MDGYTNFHCKECVKHLTLTHITTIMQMIVPNQPSEVATMTPTLSIASAKTMAKSDREELFMHVYRKALKAGIDAGLAHNPTPMRVGTPTTAFGSRLDHTRPVYDVPDGMCGFAWVVIYPANSQFSNWLKKNGIARANYGGGIQVSVQHHGQSLERKEAHARAFANVLKAYGLDRVYSSSRAD